jgi:dipeptidase
MTRDLSAGPFNAPDRWRPMTWKVDGKTYGWERPIATQQAGFVFVSQSRRDVPDEVGGVFWYAMDNPYTCVFVPFYTSITDLPPSYTRGSLQQFTRDSAWWAFNFVANYANLRYSYMIKDIRDVQERIENLEFDLQPAIERTAIELLKSNPQQVAPFLTRWCISNAEMAVQDWWNLADHLVTKYNDGYIKNEKGRPQEVGYPEEWLREELRRNPDKFRIKQTRKGEGEL